MKLDFWDSRRGSLLPKKNQNNSLWNSFKFDEQIKGEKKIEDEKLTHINMYE